MVPSAAEFVRDVEGTVDACLAAAPREADGARVLERAARHLVLGGSAKRLRPMLVRLVGELVCAPAQALTDVAVAGELIHASSLLHDDVVDDGKQRRGLPTANVLFGNAVAVLAGDWLLARAFQRLRPYPAELTFSAIDCVAEMAAAAVGELEARGKADLDRSALVAIAAGKTGALFAWCGRATAAVAGRDDVADALERFGRHLGVAFQMADDLKDLAEANGGKPRFADIVAKNPSFALTCAAERSPAFAHALARAWEREALSAFEVEALGRLALAAGADAARAALDAELAAAEAALGQVGERAWQAHLAPLAEAFTRDLPGRRT